MGSTMYDSDSNRNIICSGMDIRQDTNNKEMDDMKAINKLYL